MFGSALEIQEENITWLAKGYGIVRDELWFRFNEPNMPQLYYDLYLSSCRHCEGSSFSRSDDGIFDQTNEVNFNQLEGIDDYNDSYQKIRSYGIQSLPLNLSGN